MTDRELDAQLRALRPPERDPDYWEWFPRRVLAEVRAGARPRPRRRGLMRVVPRLAWASGLSLVAAVAVLCVESPRQCPVRVAVASLKSFARLPSDLAQLPESMRALMRVDRGLGSLIEEQP
ncbi:MAG: hypothetical protein N3I86_10730 [Verrucomicrobiae bacterium]|nr:hypothetical protein [Verrucomicrobiae bacterium]